MAAASGSRQVIEGPYHTAVNQLQTYLHNDEAARAQGFRGGVVGGPNFLAYANTLIEEQLGERWTHGGRLHTRFRSPVYAGDRVRAVLTLTGQGERWAADVLLKNQQGEVVAEGDASLVEPGFEATGRTPRRHEPEGLVQLSSLARGERMPPPAFDWFRFSVVPDAEDVAAYCERNQDRLASPERIPLAYLPRLLFNPVRWLLDAHGVGPGLYGELDIRQYRPLVPGARYEYGYEVVATRRRGKFELLDSAMTAHDAAGVLVAAVEETHLFPPHED
jgi:acyl dehydratase